MVVTQGTDGSLASGKTNAGASQGLGSNSSVSRSQGGSSVFDFSELNAPIRGTGGSVQSAPMVNGPTLAPLPGAMRNPSVVGGAASAPPVPGKAARLLLFDVKNAGGRCLGLIGRGEKFCNELEAVCNIKSHLRRLTCRTRPSTSLLRSLTTPAI